MVCGQLQTRNWTDKQGYKHYAAEVVADEVAFVESKGGGADPDGGVYVPSAYTSPPAQASFEDVDNDDDLPF